MSVRHASEGWITNKHHLTIKEIPEEKRNPRCKREGYQDRLAQRQMQGAPAHPATSLHKGPTKPKGGGETFQKDLADRKIGTYHSPHRGSASRF